MSAASSEVEVEWWNQWAPGMSLSDEPLQSGFLTCGTWMPWKVWNLDFQLLDCECQHCTHNCANEIATGMHWNIKLKSTNLITIPYRYGDRIREKAMDWDIKFETSKSHAVLKVNITKSQETGTSNLNYWKWHWNSNSRISSRHLTRTLRLLHRA